MGIQLVMVLILKKFERRNIAQFLAALVLPIYLYTYIKTVDIVYNCDGGKKGCFEVDSRNKSLVHAWIILEIIQFFYWIISLSIFLALSYILKLKSIRKTDVDEGED